MKIKIYNTRFTITSPKVSSFILMCVLLIGLSPKSAKAQAGLFDESFEAGMGANQRISSFIVLPNDKIIIGGRFTSYDGVDINRLTRLNANGERDITFQEGSGFDGEDDHVEVIQRSGLGEYYVGGVFSSYNGVARKNILRINGDGILDPDFDPGTGTIGIVLEIAVQSDNKVLISGGFGSYNGQTARGLFRALYNGNFDDTYVSLLNSDAVVNSIYIDNASKAYIAGSFGSFDGQLVNKLAKLMPDGGLDELFQQDHSCNSFIDKIIPSGDGNFYIIGNFTEYAGVEVNKVAKINSQGNLTGSFNVGSGPDYYLYDAVVQSDGKIIIVGNFTTFNEVPAYGIVRLMDDGSVDPTFLTGSGTNSTGSILQCGLQSDGKIIIAGSFTEFNGYQANRIARLINDIPNGTGIASTNSESMFQLYPNPSNQTCSIISSQSNKLLQVQISDIHGRGIKTISTEKLIDVSDLESGLYLVNIANGQSNQILKLLVN